MLFKQKENPYPLVADKGLGRGLAICCPDAFIFLKEGKKIKSGGGGKRQSEELYIQCSKGLENVKFFGIC